MRRGNARRIYLTAEQQFHFYTKGPERRVKTDRYSYALALDEDFSDELLLWHWHPGASTIDYPHLHACGKHPAFGTLRKLHIPSGRVAFEQIVQFLIGDLGVVPKRKDWQKTLSETENRFRTHRSWE